MFDQLAYGGWLKATMMESAMLRDKVRQAWRLTAAEAGRLVTPADRRGVTAVEYAIIAGVVAAVIVLSVTAIGPELATTFNKVATPL